MFDIRNQLSMISIYIPCRKDLNSPEMARLFFEYIMFNLNNPDTIVTDQCIQQTSRFCFRVCSDLWTDHQFSTGFHPLQDGQNDTQSQTMELYFRDFDSQEPENLAQILPLDEWDYNHVVHKSMRITPFLANLNYHPVMQCHAPNLS